MNKPRRRCAIYTRKSSEEGLDQAFNSLHAQREACEAYVRSQAGEGWTLIRTPYDDGGFSGGTLNRPAMSKLMADVGAGLIDVVVVYKVDRLTRSLADFAKIIELFDAKGASFVSVTQAFNTTSSMGRLTLNVLLSFAQFEREVTGERIRDKIAASKARGMWMGGVPPLGYDRPTDQLTRALVVNPDEADLLRALFRRYLELGSVNLLHRALEADGVRSKAWIAASGDRKGGLPISRGALCHLLKNRTFLGEILHKGKSYPGAHPAILDASMFERVQQSLAARTAAHGERPTPSSTAALKGRLYDQDGAVMTPTFAHGRGGRRYRYYVSAPVQQGRESSGAAVRRISSPALEELILHRCRAWIGRELHWPELLALLVRVDLAQDSMVVTLDGSAVFKDSPDREHAATLFARRLGTGEQLRSDPADPDMLRIRIPVRPQLRGGQTFMMGVSPLADAKPRPDPVMIKGLRSSHALLEKLGAQPWKSATELAAAKAPGDSYERRLICVALLAPDIQAAILDGRQPAILKLASLTRRDLPLAWADQRALLGMAARG
jgi:DNA invertase Pin-like site-specific DNA recombinase